MLAGASVWMWRRRCSRVDSRDVRVPSRDTRSHPRCHYDICACTFEPSPCAHRNTSRADRPRKAHNRT
ncbi:hypothetical protein KTR9_3543 [Gordonia sp. KTR9]|nr:hypothetical protein KTR9_3543 [Gordonia sp. KTR9]